MNTLQEAFMETRTTVNVRDGTKVMVTHELPVTPVLLIIAQKLRNQWIVTETDSGSRRKMLDKAIKRGFSHFIHITPQSLESGEVIIRDLQNKEDIPWRFNE